MGKLTVNETRAIIKARLHMTKVPGNYKKLGIDVCPLCNQKEVSTEDYFECNRGQGASNLRQWQTNTRLAIC